MIERPVPASTDADQGDQTASLVAQMLGRYEPGDFYDEALIGPRVARAHYQPLFRTLGAMSAEDVRERRLRLDRAFMNQGVTFTVYKDDAGIERIFPFDPMPRIITRRKWERIAEGL